MSDSASAVATMMLALNEKWTPREVFLPRWGRQPDYPPLPSSLREAMILNTPLPLVSGNKEIATISHHSMNGTNFVVLGVRYPDKTYRVIVANRSTGEFIVGIRIPAVILSVEVHFADLYVVCKGAVFCLHDLFVAPFQEACVKYTLDDYITFV